MPDQWHAPWRGCGAGVLAAVLAVRDKPGMEEFSPLLAPAIAGVLALVFVVVRALRRAQPFLTVNPWEHGLL